MTRVNTCTVHSHRGVDRERVELSEYAVFLLCLGGLKGAQRKMNDGKELTAEEAKVLNVPVYFATIFLLIT